MITDNRQSHESKISEILSTLYHAPHDKPNEFDEQTLVGGGGLLDSLAQLTDAGASTRGRQWRLTLTVDIGGSTHDKQRRLAVGLTFEQEARSGLAELELAPAALGPPVRVVAEEDVVVVVDER